MFRTPLPAIVTKTCNATKTKIKRVRRSSIVETLFVDVFFFFKPHDNTFFTRTCGWQFFFKEKTPYGSLQFFHFKKKYTRWVFFYKNNFYDRHWTAGQETLLALRVRSCGCCWPHKRHSPNLQKQTLQRCLIHRSKKFPPFKNQPLTTKPPTTKLPTIKHQPTTTYNHQKQKYTNLASIFKMDLDQQLDNSLGSQF